MRIYETKGYNPAMSKPSAPGPADGPKIHNVAIDKVKPNPRNSRTHSPEQLEKIAASIRQFGFMGTVLVDSNFVLLAGHGRREAAKMVGLQTLPCIIADHLTEAQRRAYMIADNRIAEDAGWDAEILADEFAFLEEADFDLGITGFEADEIDELMAEPSGGRTADDDTPEPPVTPVSKIGDAWILGSHRLVCGDSTDPLAMLTLMGQKDKADLVFTDPPYNVAYSGRGDNNLGTIENDDMPDEDFEKFLAAVFSSCSEFMRDNACIYVCHPDSQTGPKLAFEKTFGARFKKSSTIIWCKQSAGMGWQDYRAQHEPILYGWKPGKSGKHFFCGDRTKTTIWDIGRDAQASYVHPTQKPVALPVEAIENSSARNDIVLDLFGGSGSTLIACEKTGRKGRLMELDPKFVDVIVRRWQAFTGKHATRESDGAYFDNLQPQEAAA